jgi:hypothetical protein
MSRPLSELSGNLRQRMERSIQASVAAVHADLIKGSPVDEGRFRASWFHAQSMAGPADTNEMVPENESGSYPTPPPVDPVTVDPRQNQVLINNLPYATRLCFEGWSKKAPADWFTRIADRWRKGAYLDEAARRQQR